MALFSRKKHNIKVKTVNKDGFSGWIKCTDCHELIHTKEIEHNYHCCPKCEYHYRLSARERIATLADANSFKELYGNLTTVDTLEFVDSQKYSDRLEQAKSRANSSEGVIVGTCTMGGQRVSLGVMDFNFMGGSMGSVVGERITRLIENSLQYGCPLILVSASGGARMQESAFSLMQMAKTSAALGKLHEEGIPYISVLTNPTTGGVTASFAALGDIIIAEPQALICFAGPRVIEQTIGEKLPPGAQKSEFLLEHGMIDSVTPRRQLRDNLIKYLGYLQGNELGRINRLSLFSKKLINNFTNND
ncbi:MAG: acetyl-CoA carboxylase, carboxyltransferase subunit beta [Chlamydiota bacterium]